MKKSRIFSTICGCFILAMSVYVLGGDADVEKGKNPDPNHTTSFLEWHRVKDLKNYKDKSFYAFIERNGWCTLGSSYDNQARSTSSTWSDQDGLWYMQYKKDDPFQSIKNQVNMADIDPDDRGVEIEDESTWKDFY